MQKKSKFPSYLNIFIISTIAGFVIFLLISYFDARAFSWNLVLNSAILGSILGNMMGFSNALVAALIMPRVEVLPRPLNLISKVLIHFLTSVFAAALFFVMCEQLGVMRALRRPKYCS